MQLTPTVCCPSEWLRPSGVTQRAGFSIPCPPGTLPIGSCLGVSSAGALRTLVGGASGLSLPRLGLLRCFLASLGINRTALSTFSAHRGVCCPRDLLLPTWTPGPGLSSVSHIQGGGALGPRFGPLLPAGCPEGRLPAQVTERRCGHGSHSSRSVTCRSAGLGRMQLRAHPLGWKAWWGREQTRWGREQQVAGAPSGLRGPRTAVRSHRNTPHQHGQGSIPTFMRGHARP